MNCDYTERYVQIKKIRNDSILSLNVNYTGVYGLAELRCLCCYDFAFSETSDEEFSNTCNVKPAVFEEL